MPYPVQSHILITRVDVFHSWTLPRLKVKADANPVQVNQENFLAIFLEMSIGQCTKSCGANYRFISIS